MANQMEEARWERMQGSIDLIFAKLRGLEEFQAASTSAAMEAANPKPSSDAGGSSTYGSFANLKITAEKLVKEQASVKTDLEMAHTKLRRATEQINLLEGKLQKSVNENAKLKVKQTEDSKLWQGLDSKVSSTKTLCDQLTETLQQLASQTERAEEDKRLFEEKLGKNSKALDEFNCLLHDLSAKLECAEQTIISGKQQMLQIKHEKEEMDRSYKERLCANDTIIKEKDSLIKQLQGAVDEYQAHLRMYQQDRPLGASRNVHVSDEGIAAAAHENVQSHTSDDLHISDEFTAAAAQENVQSHTQVAALNVYTSDDLSRQDFMAPVGHDDAAQGQHGVPVVSHVNSSCSLPQKGVKSKFSPPRRCVTRSKKMGSAELMSLQSNMGTKKNRKHKIENDAQKGVESRSRKRKTENDAQKAIDPSKV